MKDVKLQESSLSRIWKHTNSDRPFALLTAFRGEYTYEKNVQRNKKLAAQLRKGGYGFFYVDGAWIENQGTEDEIEVSEDSIFAIGNEGEDEKFLQQMIKHGKEYNQDGVLVKTGDGVKIYDQKGKVSLDVGTLKPGKMALVYTKLRNNKKSNTFVFESTRLDSGWILRKIQERNPIV